MLSLECETLFTTDVVGFGSGFSCYLQDPHVFNITVEFYFRLEVIFGEM